MERCSPAINRSIWIAAAILAAVLFIAGASHLAFRTSAQLYIQMHETDNKQTLWIGELFRKVVEIERKQAIFEQHMKYEAEAAAKEAAKEKAK